MSSKCSTPLDPLDTRATGFRVHAFVCRVPADTVWRRWRREIVGSSPLPCAGSRPGRPTHAAVHLEPLSRPLLVEGVDVEGHVLWGLTLRLLDDVVPRLFAGEWEV